MGGSGAKRQRQVQRTVPASSENDEDDRIKYTYRSKNAAYQASTLRPNKKYKRDDSSQRHKQQTTELNKQKKKVSKPKHLHRKLQQAEDPVVQEHLQKKLHELKQFKTTTVEKSKTNKMADVDVPLVDEPLPITVPKPTILPDDTGIVADEKSANSVQQKKDTTLQWKKNDSIKETKGDNPKDDSAKETKGDSPNQENDNDSSDDESLVDAQKRQRGKRRRGRQSTSEKEAVEMGKKESVPNSTAVSELVTGVEPGSAETSTALSRQKDERYCKGRKPVTDFVIGQCYPGKVVYVKDFGIFVDINCHIDAFCHVSRLRDDYVASPHDIFKEGDVIPAARVVELAKKRITISLQSESMQNQELNSIQSRKERRELRDRKRRKHSTSTPTEIPKSDTKKSIAKVKKLPPPQKTTGNGSVEREVMAEPGNTTPAEMKRARKLARRAARRAEKEGAEQ